jgi:hypothetical protein
MLFETFRSVSQRGKRRGLVTTDARESPTSKPRILFLLSTQHIHLHAAAKREHFIPQILFQNTGATSLLLLVSNMKFSAFIIAAAVGSASAFAPASIKARSTLSAATLEAPPAEVAEPVAENADASMEVEEKDFPVADNFVKDSDRIMP